MMRNNDLGPADFLQTQNTTVTTHTTTITTHNPTAPTPTMASTPNILSIRSKSFFDPKVLAAVWYEHKLTDAWLVPVVVILGGIVLIVSVVMLFIMRWIVDHVCLYCKRVNCCCGPPSHRPDNEQTHLTRGRQDGKGARGELKEATLHR